MYHQLDYVLNDYSLIIHGQFNWFCHCFFFFFVWLVGWFFLLNRFVNPVSVDFKPVSPQGSGFSSPESWCFTVTLLFPAKRKGLCILLSKSKKSSLAPNVTSVTFNETQVQESSNFRLSKKAWRCPIHLKMSFYDWSNTALMDITSCSLSAATQLIIAYAWCCELSGWDKAG